MAGCKVFVFLAGLCFFTSCCSCTDLLQDEEGIIRHVILEPEHLIKRRSADQPLRITTSFIDVTAVEEPERVKKAVEQATEYFRKTLKVRKTVAKILLERSCTNESYFLIDGLRYCKESCDGGRVCVSTEGVPLADFDACRVCDRDGSNCSNGTGPDLGPGQGHSDTDFVLYVTAINKEKCKDKLSDGLSTALAFASVCQQESGLDRPVVGSLNICPDTVTKKKLDNDYGRILATLKHEIFHVLGFSSSLYAFYRNASGFPLTPRGQNGLPLGQVNGKNKWSEKVIQMVSRSDWEVQSGKINHTVQVMVTPRVREEAQKHFNCTTLEGAELENQGGDGTALAHWEKRIFENEGMTGIVSQNSVFSRLTLALMEDTGWYMVNYGMAQPLLWGKNLGCLFAKNSCKAWMMRKGGTVDPFCDTMDQTPSGSKTGCTDDRTAVAMCNLVNFTTDLPWEYQYFESPKTGGNVNMADYCPYYTGFSWTEDKVTKRGSGCTSSVNSREQKNNFALEKYGETSRCFEQGKKWQRKECGGKTIITASDWGSGCYEYKCEKDGLKIILEGKKFNCFHQGQVIDVTVENSEEELYEGSLLCPPCREICTTCPADVKPAPENSQPTPDSCSSAAPAFVMKAVLFYLAVTLAVFLMEP